MKSLPVPVARARNNFSDVLEDARRGQRIRLTRHGKAVGWIIGAEERERLEAAKREDAKRAKAQRGASSRRR
jgi:prevent-host-death family protein